MHNLNFIFTGLHANDVTLSNMEIEKLCLQNCYALVSAHSDLKLLK